jgi:hypothetical protein
MLRIRCLKNRGYAAILKSWWLLAFTGVSIAFPADLPKDSAAFEGPLAFDTMAGDLPGVVTAKTLPYLVVSDIYVPQGKTVIIEAGAVFLFKNFAGLHVSGALLARGTKDRPIVFTSENDKEYNKTSRVDPAPFDWNGIYLHEDAIGTQLSFCAVLYSVDGVSSMTKFIRISPCLFLHNGRASLTIEGKQQQVGDQPYEYSLPANDPALSAALASSIAKDPNARSRAIIRYSGGAVGLTGLGVCIAFAAKWYSASRQLNQESDLSPANLAGNSNASWSAARNARNKNMAAFFSGIGIVAVGGIEVGWSFTF